MTMLYFCIFSLHYFLFPKLNICGWFVIGNFFYPFVQKTKKIQMILELACKNVKVLFLRSSQKVTLSNSMKTSTYFPFVNLRVTTIYYCCCWLLCFIFMNFFGRLKEVAVSHRQVVKI